jgi:hypothetical protein
MFIRKGWPQLASVTVLATSVLFLASCGDTGTVQAPAPTTPPAPREGTTGALKYQTTDLQELHVTLDDGSKVTCLIGAYKLWCTK